MRDIVFAAHGGLRSAPPMSAKVGADVRHLFFFKFQWSPFDFHAASSSASIFAQDFSNLSVHRFLFTCHRIARWICLVSDLLIGRHLRRSRAASSRQNVIGLAGFEGTKICSCATLRVTAIWSWCGSWTIFPSKSTTACFPSSRLTSPKEYPSMSIFPGSPAKRQGWTLPASPATSKAKIRALFASAHVSHTSYPLSLGVDCIEISRIEATAARKHWHMGFRYSPVDIGIMKSLPSSRSALSASAFSVPLTSVLACKPIPRRLSYPALSGRSSCRSYLIP